MQPILLGICLWGVLYGATSGVTVPQDKRPAHFFYEFVEPHITSPKGNDVSVREAVRVDGINTQLKTFSEGEVPSLVYLFDATYTLTLPAVDAYEHVHAIAAVAGLVNREGPILYVLLTPVDASWLSFLRQSGQWLQHTNISQIGGTAVDLVQAFVNGNATIRGAVLYDPNVASTSLVASSIAGVDSVIPICQRAVAGSLYTSLVVGGPRLRVVQSLVGMFTGHVTGSAKCDAYVWAVQNVLPHCDASKMGYYIDYYWTRVFTGGGGAWMELSHTVSNHDYFISRKGFFWDLSAWADEAPNDDPTQPLGTDRRTMQAILLAAYNQLQGQTMIHIGGFVPWLFKYVTPHGQHGGVATEWETALITSAYNAYVDADACCIAAMANAAFYPWYPLGDRYIQNPKPTMQQLQQQGLLDSQGRVVPKNYIFFYGGDYDSAAWLYSQFKPNWDDPARGSVPVGWAIDPNLVERFPLLHPYLYSTMTAEDTFTSGDSGAGYVNPTQLLPPRQFSNLPSAETVWQQHNTHFYRRFGLSFSGFLINGDAGDYTPESEKMYVQFSWDGLAEQAFPGMDVHLVATQDTPVVQQTDLGDDANAAVEAILAWAKPGQLQFRQWRGVLKSASWYKSIRDGLAAKTQDVVVLGPHTFGYLARVALGGNNNNRVVYVNDTVPLTMSAGAQLALSFTIRNDGWNALVPGQMALRCTFVAGWNKTAHTPSAASSVDLGFSQTVNPGVTGVVRGTVIAPSSAGQYTFSYDVVYITGPMLPFSVLGNPPWLTRVRVV